MTKINKNGFTLIEVLISLAIASIMVLVGYQLVINAVKLNKRGEDRQQATLVGQQIIEEIKILEDDNITSSSLKLNERLILEGHNNGSGYEYKGELVDGNNEYKVDIVMEKNNIEFKENYQKNNISYDLRIDITNTEDSLVIKNNDTQQINQISLIGNEKSKIIIENKEKNDEILEDSNEVSAANIIIESKDKVFLDLTNYNFKKYIDIEIYNNLNSKLTVYVQKPLGLESNIEARNMIGLVEIHNNPITDNIGYSYKVSVVVKKK